MADRLKGKVVIIGGGTSGMGTAMVELFGAEGAQVVFSGRRAEAGVALEEKIRALGYDVTYVQGDLSKNEDMEKLVRMTIEKYGKINVLVNNHAVGGGGNAKIEDLDIDKYFDSMFNLNVRSTMYLTKLVVPYMKQQGGGSIVNFSSVSSQCGSPKFSIYAATKGAINQVTKTTALEYAADNIRCNAVSPGMTYTDKMIRGSKHAEASLAVVPMKRGAEPMEQAYAALFFATDECPFCTGTILNVDGAQMCGPVRPEED